MKRLQFGTKNCIKLHVGKTKNETLCKDVSVGGWKLTVETDAETSQCVQNEQEDSSMVSKVFQATCTNTIQNDFVNSCKKYLESLEIQLDFEEIRKMSKYQFKKLVKEKITEAGFKYLIQKKNEKGKQRKIEQLEYSKLSIQE